MNRLDPLRWLERPWMSSGWLVIGSVLAVIPLLWLARLPDPQPGMSALAIEFPGTANTALAVLRALADADLISSVRAAVMWDFLLVVAYVMACVSLLGWLHPDNGRSDELFPHAIRGALLAGFFDVLEDLGILFLLSHLGDPQHALFGVVSLLTTLFAMCKWTLLVAVTGYSVWELTKKLGASWRRRGPGTSAR